MSPDLQQVSDPDFGADPSFHQQIQEIENDVDEDSVNGGDEQYAWNEDAVGELRDRE